MRYVACLAQWRLRRFLVTRPWRAPALSSSVPGPPAWVPGNECRLNELGYDDWVILEAADAVGRVARSCTDDAGFTYDVGGHLTTETSRSTHKPEPAETIVERVVDGLVGTGVLEPADRSRIVSRWLCSPEMSLPGAEFCSFSDIHARTVPAPASNGHARNDAALRRSGALCRQHG